MNTLDNPRPTKLCVAQSGRVPVLETGCRRFKSYRADQIKKGGSVFPPYVVFSKDREMTSHLAHNQKIVGFESQLCYQF